MSQGDDRVRAEIKRRQSIIGDAYDAGDEIVRALSNEGDRAYEWTDKPHRIAYDLIVERADLRAERNRLRSQLSIIKCQDPQSKKLGEATMFYDCGECSTCCARKDDSDAAIELIEDHLKEK